MQLLKGDNYKREINRDKISTNNVSVGGVSLVQTKRKKIGGEGIKFLSVIDY